MNNPKRTVACIAAVSLCLALPALAEDIDIYSAPTGPEDNPNILIIVDNSANWSRQDQHWPGGLTQGQAELNAIRTVIQEAQVNSSVNIGLMMFTDDKGTVGDRGENGDGAYVRYHIRPMNSINRDGLGELIGNPVSCTDGSNSVNSTPNCIYKNFNDSLEKVPDANYSAAMFEAFKYFGGHTDPENAGDVEGAEPNDAGHFGVKRYAGAPDAKTDRAAFLEDAKTNYSRLIDTTEYCANNYIIFIGNGFPKEDDDHGCNASGDGLLQGVNGDCSIIAVPEFTTLVDELGEPEVLLGATACGLYASVAECKTAASERWGAAYENYSCTQVDECSEGTVQTVVEPRGVTACGPITDEAQCRTELIADPDTATETYSCAELENSCSWWEDIVRESVIDSDGYSQCIPDSLSPNGNEFYPAKCATWAEGQFPNFGDFDCDVATASKVGCPNKSAKWKITAGQRRATGKSYTMLKTTTTTAISGSLSFKIEAQRRSTMLENAIATVPPAKNRWADEWTRYLRNTDVSPAPGIQSVKTYTIDVFNAKQSEDQTALLYSMASKGGGGYYAAKNEAEIANALRKIMSEIQSVNSIFASSSLPVSVNMQGTYLNQVFIGMFRPDAGGAPRWAGNLKQYQFKFFADEMKLADKFGDAAISHTTGFITPCADSMWTTDTGAYWEFGASDAIGSCTAQGTSLYSDAPDGDVVEKGGVAQKLRGSTLAQQWSTNYSTRNVKTCVAPNCDSLVDFNTTNVTSLTADLVNWVRGKDVDDENANSRADEVRPSVHGGVIHSQPAVLDFGNYGGVVAFYGADDGIFHAINGADGDTGGNELWGFIAPETFGQFARLRANSPLISFPNVIGQPKNYFFDGPIGVYQVKNQDSAPTTWIFPTMRRGGRAIYAFDVTTPSSPTIKWRRGCFTSDVDNDLNCSSDDWNDIGQTWSKPLVAYIEGYVDENSLPKPVLVFGGGYDTCEDADEANPTCSDPKGANIWFVDAADGTLLHKYSTYRSVPGDVALVSRNGFLKYVYAADTGGNIYRITIGQWDAVEEVPANWSEGNIRLAAFGGDGKKFLSGPDVVRYTTQDADGITQPFIAVLAGTGDRERPLYDNYTCGDGTPGFTNMFFMIKDTLGALPNPPYGLNNDGDENNLVLLNEDNPTLAQSELVSVNGWAFELGPCEQVVNKPLVFAGTVYFGTNEPLPEPVAMIDDEMDDTSDPGACGRNLGVARGYSVDFLTGRRTSTTFDGGGLPPSPVAGVVEVDGVKVPFVIGGGGQLPADDNGDGIPDNPVQSKPPNPFDPDKVKISPPSIRTKLYWHKEND